MRNLVKEHPSIRRKPPNQDIIFTNPATRPRKTQESDYSSKRRILMISTHGYFESRPSFGRPDTGGQITFVIELSKALAKLDYRVDILTRQFGNLDHMEPVNEDVRIIRIPCGGRDFIPKEYIVDSLPELIQGFTKYCRENDLKYEFIDSHYWDAGFVGLEFARTFRTPHIFTPHSLGVWKREQKKRAAAEGGVRIDELELEKKHNFKRRIETEKTIMQNANRVIATTPEQQRIIVKDYATTPEKVAVIPPGFSPKKFCKIPRREVSKLVKRYNLPRRFITSVGRITSYKGYDLMIQAFKFVAEQIPELYLVLRIGSEEPIDVARRQELTQLAAKLEVGDRTRFLGYIEELEAFYNAADALIMPSTYEPFGLVAIESMACGTPAVITSRGGLKDFLADGQDALIVDPRDTQALAKAILSLLEDRNLYEAIARRGYEKVHSAFTWEIIAATTLKTISAR